MKGAAITRITLRMIQEWLIPVPPIEEQRRIAEKVDLLLPKIKEYGKAQDALNKLNAELPERLKKSILQEAIEGRLVPQDPNDEPASVLLDKIRQEKAQLVKAGKLKKKDLIETPISEDEIPFEIPDSWEWAKLGDVTEIARGGSPRPIKEYLTNAPNGLNWIKIGDTDKGGKYINSCKEKIKPEGLKKTRMVHPGDFLLTNSMSFGRPYITNIEGCIHDGWLMISPYAGVFDQSFLFYVLSSAFAHKQFNDKVAGAVVQNLNSDKVADSIIPLPPLAEQHRIVKKLEQLLGKIELMNK
jgi:type I restriction enzyme S subunit